MCPPDNDPSLEAQHRDLRPIHAVCEEPAVKVRRLAGRPVRAKVKPTFDQAEYVRHLSKLRAAWTDADVTVQALVRGAERAELLRALSVAIAEELASLRWEKEHASANDVIVALGVRRIDGLAKLASVQLALAKLEWGEVRPRQVERAATFFLETVTGILNETLGPERGTEIVGRITRAFEGWQEKIEKVGA